VKALVADAGNSKVVLARWRETEGQRLATIERLHQAGTPRTASTRRAWLTELSLHRAQNPGLGLVLASVVPDLTCAVQDTFPDCQVIDHTLPFPFGVQVEEPADVGADRYCNVAAAVSKGYRDALVIDVGTATTFDLLLEGDFAGGLIAPGMALAAAKLAEEAARLQPVAFEPCPLEVGKSTRAAMQAGTYHVAVNGVLATARALLAHYGSRPVILTGGLAATIKNPDWSWQPDWTLIGAGYLSSLTSK